MQPESSVNRIDTLGLVLAGGRSRRMGGRDKAWLRLSGKPLICHAFERLRPQVDDIVVSANRHRWAYRRMDIDVVSDRPAWAGRGPLAAIATVLSDLRPRRLAVVPVDAPLAPRDHVAALSAALDAGAQAAAIFDGERQQPLFCLLAADVTDDARSAVEREPLPSMRDWLEGIGVVWINRSHQHALFANINMPDDLRRLVGTP